MFCMFNSVKFSEITNMKKKCKQNDWNTKEKMSTAL